jgi:monoamine oxidase
VAEGGARGRREAALIDVVVIGAGAAGVTAAAALARARRSALLIDGRDRIGGRIWSLNEPGLPVPVELGAEFIHGLSKPTFALLERTGGAALDANRDHFTLREGKLVPSENLFAQIRVAMTRSAVLEKRDISLDAYIERHLKHELTSEASAYARMLAQGFDAADTSRASARAIVEEWTGGGSVEAPQFRPLGGYGVLLSALAGELNGSSVDVQLDTTVRNVRWSRAGVRVSGACMGGPFEVKARRAIVTLPLGVLQRTASTSDHVRFTPALASKRSALKHLAPGPVLKVLLRFRHAFWERADRGRYKDVDFFHPREASFPTFWTALPVRTPLLVAWAAGPKAQRLAGAGKPRLVSEALDSLAALFGHRDAIADQLQAAWVHDWQSDPFARGAYSYVTVGGDNARKELAKPLGGTLFFAGEATDVEEAGTVGGALRSGERAAAEVLASFRS